MGHGLYENDTVAICHQCSSQWFLVLTACLNRSCWADIHDAVKFISIAAIRLVLCSPASYQTQQRNHGCSKPHSFLFFSTVLKLMTYPDVSRRIPRIRIRIRTRVTYPWFPL